MSDTDTSTHPILATYTATPLDGYNITFDGFGGVRGMIEVNGQVYEIRGHRKYRYRIIKIMPDGSESVHVEGTSQLESLGLWVPQDFGCSWPPRFGTEQEYCLALEVEDHPGAWRRINKIH